MAKSAFVQSTETYASLFKKAFLGAFRHPWLWPFGFLAAALQSGSILSDVLRFTTKLAPANSLNLSSLQASLEAYAPWLTEIAGQILRQDDFLFSLSLFTFCFAFFAFLLLALTGQQGLAFGVSSLSHGKHPTFWDTLTSLKHMHYLRLFAVNALLLLSLALLLLLSATPLMALLDFSRPFYSLAVYTAFFLFLLPIGFLLQATGIFAILLIVSKNLPLIPALLEAWQKVRTHLLSIFEISLFLFLLNIIVFLLVKHIIALLLTPFALALLLVIAANAAPSFLFGLFGTVFFAFAAIILYGAIIGWTVSVNYLTFALALRKMNRFGIMSTIEGLLRKR